MPAPLLANLDYGAFVLVTMAVFAVVAWVLKRRCGGATLPPVVWVLVVLILIGGWWAVEKAGHLEEKQIEQWVTALAPTYARELARLGHAGLTPETPPDDPLRQKLLRATLEWMQDNPNAHDIYTMRQAPDGRRIFILDGDTDYNHDGVISETELGASPGEEFSEKDTGLDRALNGETNFNFEPVTDHWGTWVGAWAPIRDAEGKVEAVVGVDYDARDWFAAIAEVRRDRMVQLALLIAVIGGAGAAVGRLRTDLQRRREAEEEARRANERWKLIVEQMPLVFIELNPQAEVLAWNPAAERTFGRTTAEMLGTKALDVIVPATERGGIDLLWNQLLQQSGGQHSVNENVTRDGRTITCEWFNTPVMDHQGRVVSIISLAQDLTARRTLEQQMQQAQKLQGIGLLAAGIAHDFNNILTIVQGHAELLLGRHDLPGEAVEDIGRIGEAAERAATLTRQLLSFSRRQAMFTRPIDLNETVANTTAMLGRVLGVQIRIGCDLAAALPAVEADPSMLEQVITNLAVNARDAMPRGGRLSVSTRLVEVGAEGLARHAEARPGPAVCLTVADTGTGIAPETLPSIFEPFFTTKEVGKGTGLGLAAVHGIVQQHHGWIEVSSEMGTGTTFEIFLPCAAPAAARLAAAPTAPEAPVATEQMTVLLVEDEPTVRQLARVTLARQGYEVLEAADGPTAEAIWTRASERIALLCTDMVMPNGLSGNDLAEIFLGEKADLGVVYCSGYSAELAAPDFCESPRQRFLQKPYLPRDLLAAVQQCLNGAGATNQARAERAA